jgi:uncharacterized FlgJ-related protein
MRASKFNVLVTTYEYIIKDKAVLSKVRITILSKMTECSNSQQLVKIDFIQNSVIVIISKDLLPVFYKGR